MTKSVANLLMPFTIFLTLLSARAFAFDEFRTNKVGQWDLEADLKYFNATANYSRGGGEYNSLADGFSYTLMDFDVGARWVPTAKWGIFAQGRYSFATSNDAVTERTYGGFSQGLVGVDYQLGRFASFNLMPEFTFLMPLNRVDVASDKALNGEGAMEVSGRLVAKTQWGFFEPMAFIGLTYRDEGRSALLPYGVGAEMNFSGLVFGGELRGYQSITDDDKTSSPLSKESVALKNGGALKFYSVNPDLLETNVWLRFNQNGSLRFKIGGGTTITGASQAAGWNIFTTLNYVFDGSSIMPESRAVETDPAVHFREETNDGVDQNIFRAPPPPPKPKPKPTPNPMVQKKKLQQELDQTEMSIELRTTKKKKPKVK